MKKQQQEIEKKLDMLNWSKSKVDSRQHSQYQRAKLLMIWLCSEAGWRRRRWERRKTRFHNSNLLHWTRRVTCQSLNLSQIAAIIEHDERHQCKYKTHYGNRAKLSSSLQVKMPMKCRGTLIAGLLTPFFSSHLSLISIFTVCCRREHVVVLWIISI